MWTRGMICWTWESSAVWSVLDGNRRQVELTGYADAADGLGTSMKLNPTWQAFARYWIASGAYS